MAAPDGRGEFTGTGPPAGWPPSPPVQAPVQPHGSGPPGPYSADGPVQYGTQPAYGPTGYITPIDLRWGSGKVFGVTWAFTTMASPIAGGLLGAIFGGLIASGLMDPFGAVLATGQAAAFGVIVGGFLGAVLGVGVGILPAVVAAAIAAQTAATTPPGRCGLLAGGGAGFTTALLVWLLASGTAEFAAVLAFGLVPGAVAAAVVWGIVGQVCRRVQAANDAFLANPTQYGSV